MPSTKKIIVLCLFLLSPAFFAHAKSVFIVVHGTWSADAAWYLPKGDFFDALEQTVSKKNSAVVSFRWSGGASHDARLKASHHLAKLIQTYDPSVAIYIIAHSHGGNVAALASHVLAEDSDNLHHIRALFNLGTPIMSNYFPNMATIHYLYNLFSFEDLIQTVFGISVREYPQHKRIANLRVFIDGKEPNHAGLHHALIGKWLPYLHQHFKQYLFELGVKDDISEPSIVYFAHDSAPEYLFDINRTELLARDRQICAMMLDSLRRSLRGNRSSTVENEIEIIVGPLT